MHAPPEKRKPDRADGRARRTEKEGQGRPSSSNRYGKVTIDASVGEAQRLSNFLADHAERAKEAYAVYTAAEQTAIAKALEAGALLAAAKDACRHGEWLPFLDRTNIPERKAQRLIQLARSGLKSDTVSDLGGIKASLRYIATCRLPGEGKWLIVDRAREDADDGEPCAYAIIKPAAMQDFFEVVVHAAGKTTIYWPIRADRVWNFIDQKLTIPISERIFVSTAAGNRDVAKPENIGMLGKLPSSYLLARSAVRKCIEVFTKDNFAAANEALNVVIGESWWWPALPGAWTIIADDTEMEELCDRMFDLARQHEAKAA